MGAEGAVGPQAKLQRMAPAVGLRHRGDVLRHQELAELGVGDRRTAAPGEGLGIFFAGALAARGGRLVGEQGEHRDAGGTDGVDRGLEVRVVLSGSRCRRRCGRRGGEAAHVGQRHQGEAGGEGGEGGQAAAGGGAETRDHGDPPSQLPSRRGHGQEAGQRGHAPRRGEQLEQGAAVVGALAGVEAAEGEGVGGQLAVGLHPPAGVVHRRVEPMKGDEETTEELAEAVAAPEMRQLVEQDVAELALGQAGEQAVREEDAAGGPAASAAAGDAGGDGGAGDGVALEQVDRTAHCHRPPAVGQDREHRRIGHRPGGGERRALPAVGDDGAGGEDEHPQAPEQGRRLDDAEAGGGRGSGAFGKPRAAGGRGDVVQPGEQAAGSAAAQSEQAEQAERARRPHRQQQPQGDQAPQRVAPGGREPVAQEQPDGQQQADHQRRLPRRGDQPAEERAQGHASSSLRSRTRRSSSISAGVSSTSSTKWRSIEEASPAKTRSRNDRPSRRRHSRRGTAGR